MRIQIFISLMVFLAMLRMEVFVYFDIYIKSVPRHKKEFQEFINKFAAATGFFKICKYTFTFFSWIENFNVNKNIL